MAQRGAVAVVAFALAIVMVAVVAFAVLFAVIGGGAQHQVDAATGADGCGNGVPAAQPVAQATGDPSKGGLVKNARIVIGVGKGLGLDEKAILTGLVTMLTESGGQNYANDGKNTFNNPDVSRWWYEHISESLKYAHDAVGNDSDSLGIMQGRPSQGWGGPVKEGDTAALTASIKRLMDPAYAAASFYGAVNRGQGLLSVPNRAQLDPAALAQRIQGSAFPDRYAGNMDKARQLYAQHRSAPVVKVTGASKPAEKNASSGGDTAEPAAAGAGCVQAAAATGSAGGWTTPAVGPLASPFGRRLLVVDGQDVGNHTGADVAAACGAPVYAAAAGRVLTVTKDPNGANIVLIDHPDADADTLYAHMGDGTITVKQGDQVPAGKLIAKVGETGLAQGCHLHFELRSPATRNWVDFDKSIDPVPFLAKHGVKLGVMPAGGISASTGKTAAKPAGGQVAAMIAAGRRHLGKTPYSWGGGGLNGPSTGINGGGALDARSIVGFDCSSFVQYMVYQGTSRKVALPRTGTEQYQLMKAKGRLKPMNALVAGDLIYFGPSTGALTHVAMYIGDGKMIQAANPSDGVNIAPVSSMPDAVAASWPTP